MTDLLHADKLRKEFGGLIAVNDIEFTIPTGSIVSLIGPNGAGKTTFFNMLTGVYVPTSGTRPVRRPRRDRQAAARDHGARDRPHVPEHPPLPAHDVARERPRRHALPPAAAGSSARSSARRGSRREEREARERARELLRVLRPARRATTSSRATCPTATSGGSRWRGRSRPSRSCCSSTSRRRA